MDVRSNSFIYPLAFVAVWVSIASSATPVVLHEEVVTRFSAANNGATPMWCFGSPVIVRDDASVYVSIIETGKDVPPLCNTRWQLWKRQKDDWKVILGEKDFRQREPCPLVRSANAGLFLSANPSLTKPGTRYRACKPTVFNIHDERSGVAASEELPRWSAVANFNDHSYRGFAADSERGEVLLLNIDTKTGEQFVSLRDATGSWQPRGKIGFPIRSAYPQVAMRHGTAHLMIIGDIREPNEEWQAYKRSVTKREWDYVFRRLFYSVAPELSRGGEFQAPIEIESVEATAGHILNLDLHVDASGAAHLLYLMKPHQHAFMRDKYFPGQPITAHLKHVVMQDQRIVRRETVAETPKNGHGFEPVYARFHVAPGEKLSVVMAGKIKEPKKPDREVNVVQGIDPPTVRETIPLEHPFRAFFTATPRAGCEPSNVIDMFGTADDIPNLRYVAVQLPSE